MMKTLTAVALALGLGFAPAAFADKPAPAPLNNESFVAQIGAGNAAIVGQAKGDNMQGTLQIGARNFALTDQHGGQADSANKSGIGQFGFANSAVTLQKASSTVQNTSATFQAGAFNHAFVVQH